MFKGFSTLGCADEGAFDRLRASIDPEWIESALSTTKTATLRRRRLPGEQVIWLVLGMALYRQRPIDELVEQLDLVMPDSGPTTVAKSGVSKARARVGEKPLKWLFERCAETWGHESARRHSWRGLALYGADGTSFRVPDSPENRAAFDSRSAGPERGLNGYPIARGVTLMALRSHILVGAAFGGKKSELALAEGLWSKLPDASLTIVDRLYLVASVLMGIHNSGEERHWLTRAKSLTKWEVIETLGDGDQLVEITLHKDTRAAHPELPKQWRMRALRYQRAGHPPQTLLTSLVDASKYPASEVRELYHERWEIELGYDEVKTHMLERVETIRSKTPTGVMQELWAIGLVYNLVRLEMERIAKEAELPPSRISFVMSLRLIRDEWLWAAGSRSPGAIPKNLRRLRDEIKRFILPPRRTDRVYPRAVKVKVSNYPRKRTAATNPGLK